MQQRLRHAKCSSMVQSNKTLNGHFSLFRSEAVSSYSSPPEKSENYPIFHNTKLKCLDFQGIFMVQLHLSIYVRSLEKSENHIPFINFISLFRRGELCSPLCFCFYTITIKKRTEFPSAFIHFSITPGQEQPSGFSGGKNSSTGNSTP